MKEIYKVISRENFESLPLDKQVGIFKLFYPNLIQELREAYLESVGEHKKENIKSSKESFLDDIGAPKGSYEEDYEEDGFLEDLK